MKMSNELLLVLELLFVFVMALTGYRLFGKAGLYCLTAITTILGSWIWETA